MKAVLIFIVVSISLGFVSCASPRADLRALVPAETIIYLETDDIGASLRSVFESRPLKESKVKVPNLSALDGIQAAVAITGFEMHEEKLSDEQSVGKITPRFALIADTHGWNFQARGFAETKLASFVADIYGGEPKLEKSEKEGGSYYAWTAADGRKAFALVIGSMIYFGNDESVIEHCLAAKKGEMPAFDAKALHQPSPENLAYGYISPDGMAQLANVLGIRLASESAEQGEVRTAIAGILPRLIRGAVSDVHWTAKKTDKGIEDRWEIEMPKEIAAVLSETLAPSDEPADQAAASLIPANAVSATRYSLRDPQVAWRSIVLTAEHLSDPFAARVFSEIGASLFEPYGVTDPEKFLSSIDGRIVTAALSSEQAAAIVRPKVGEELKGIAGELEPGSNEKAGEPADTAVTFVDGLGVLGDKDTVAACASKGARSPLAEQLLLPGKPSIVTAARDDASIREIVSFLGDEKDAVGGIFANSRAETSFTRSGVVRTTVSDLGFIGSIIGMLADTN